MKTAEHKLCVQLSGKHQETAQLQCPGSIHNPHGCLKLLWLKMKGKERGKGGEGEDRRGQERRKEFVKFLWAFLLDLRFFFNNIKLAWFKWITVKLTFAHVSKLAWRVTSTDCMTFSKGKRCVGNLKIILLHLLVWGHTGVTTSEERLHRAEVRVATYGFSFTQSCHLPPKPQAGLWGTLLHPDVNCS